jgi:hypothetical protein
MGTHGRGNPYGLWIGIIATVGIVLVVAWIASALLQPLATISVSGEVSWWHLTLAVLMPLAVVFGVIIFAVWWSSQ